MGTSFKIKFRSSTVEGKAGTVYYQIIHNRQVARINTDIHVHPNEWKALYDNGNSISGMSLFIRKRINCDMERVKTIIQKCENSGTNYSVKTIVAFYKMGVSDSQSGERHTDTSRVSGQSLFTFMRNRIKELKKEQRNGTAANYRHTLNSFLSFAAGCDITMPMITEELMERYEAWLKVSGLKRNSISFYMRVLRAVYNRAIRKGLVRQAFPFRNVYTGIDKTRKRAVKEEVIIALNKLDLSDKPALQLARDLFMFSFTTCGMPFVDMAYLKKSNVRNGYIRYERKKTGQPLQVRILPFIKNVMRKYAKESSPYVFPIITSTEPKKAYHQYRNALMNYNHCLHKLSDLLPEPTLITSYVSRHSWATIARDHGNTAPTIGKALGHTNENTTQIYLDSIGETEVDKMNEEIISHLQG